MTETLWLTFLHTVYIATLIFNTIHLLVHVQFQQMSLSAQQTCLPLKPYKRMTSSWWRVLLRTAATGRQLWDGLTQLHVTISLMTSSLWQPATRRLHHSWRLQPLLVYTALRLFVLLTLRQHLWTPQLLTYRVTQTSGCHRHSTCSVSLHSVWFKFNT